MVTPNHALVRPRVHSPLTGELVLLEDAVRPLVEDSSKPGAIAILGPPGSGKTTALAHLAAALPPRDHVRFFDEPDLDELRLPMTGHFVIFTYAGELPRDFCEAFYLAGWDRDDWIEYLLAAHKDHCSSVLARIQPADASLLDGNPALSVAVLDALAKDESLRDGNGALLKTVERQIEVATEVTRLQAACLTALVGPRRIEGKHWLAAESNIDRRRKLLRHSQVQILMAARRIVADLSDWKRGDYFSHPWPQLLVGITASFLVEDKPRAKLTKIFERRVDAQPMAASLLYALDPSWRPRAQKGLNLERAYLSRVSWGGLQLEASRLSMADLSAADLRGADLRKAILSSANLSHANLANAKMTETTGHKASFRQGSLRGIQAYRARWEEADLSGTSCTNAMFQEANPEQANLAGGDFREAQFVGAILKRANIERGDFSGANFQRANLDGLALRLAQFDGADFRGATLVGCDLEYMQFANACFQNANLSNSLLTGTVMPAANFRNAVLRNTGLAEIDWEGADLHGADSRGASFHMGSSRSGLVDSPIASEGSRTGFYTDDYNEQEFKSPEEIRKANLRGADLRGALLAGVDFYLVDLRDALYDREMMAHFRRCGAILEDRC